MKNSISIVGALFILTIVTGCNKTDSNHSVLVTVKYHGQAVEQSAVYLKYNTSTNPGIQLTEYDHVTSADAIGQAFFSKLPPGNYYFYAKGYSVDAKAYVNGQGILSFSKDGSDDCSYLTIDTDL